MNKILKTEQISRKDFSYELDGIRLNFQLRIDVKRELAAFLEILKRAQEDVDEEIKKLNK